MIFKTLNPKSEVIKPETIINPLIGVLIEKEQGKYSPIYVIRDENGKIHKVRGCKDLDSKLLNVSLGVIISLQFLKSVPTRAGNPMIIMDVKIAVEETEVETDEEHNPYKCEMVPAYGILINPSAEDENY